MNFGDMVYAKKLQNENTGIVQFGMCIHTGDRYTKFLSTGYFLYDHKSPQKITMPLLSLDKEDWKVFESSAMQSFDDLQWQMLILRANEFIKLLFENMSKGVKHII